jgi:integrase/recombinase XerD
VKVQRIVLHYSGRITWIVLDDGFSPVEPIQDFLAYLNNIERSPNTVRAYAYHLKLFWEYIQAGKLDWRAVGFRELADFIGWLRDPQSIDVIPIHERVSKRTESTINAILAAVAMFYDYHRRIGAVDCPPLELETSFRGRPYKSFLHGIGKNRPTKIRRLKLKAPKRIPSTVSVDQVSKLIEACHRLRDKFLVCLLYETGMRIGQALGLKHQDILSRERVIKIIPRNDNATGVRAKTREPYSVHVSASLMRLYADYLVDEVQDIVSDYVFVNLWREPIGEAMSVSAVEDLFRRLSKRTGISIHPHLLRHTHATELLRGGWDASYVQRRLGHTSIQTTINTYAHLTDDDLKKAYQAYLKRRQEGES